jgi:hypothetical protein
MVSMTGKVSVVIEQDEPGAARQAGFAAAGESSEFK